MTVKCVFFVLFCASFVICCCRGGLVTWVKLNTSPVCFGARDNTYGAFTPGKNAFIWAFMLKHRSGYVSCNGGHGSNWGCRPNHAHVITFLTDERNHVVGPRFSQPLAKHYYSLPGYHSSSPYLIFFMGKSAYGVHHMAELRVWYGEDLYGTTESDNSGKSCTDVYGLMYKDQNINWEISHSGEVCHMQNLNKWAYRRNGFHSIYYVSLSCDSIYCLLEYVIYKLVCVLFLTLRSKTLIFACSNLLTTPTPRFMSLN